MAIDVYNTHIEVYPYIKGDCPLIEDMFTAIDKFSDKTYPCGYMIENNKLYLPSAMNIPKLENLIGEKAIRKRYCDPYDEMSVEHESYVESRDDIQERAVEFLCGKDKQMSLTLATGMGKTVCVCMSLTNLNIKTLIVVPNDVIKKQWLKTLTKMFDYKPKNIINIAGSNIIIQIMDNYIDISNTDIFIVNHGTLHSYIMQAGGYQFHEFMKKIKVGIKVYDESHLNFANILLIDFFSDTRRTWYLSATFDRSDKTESACFRKCFQTLNTFGENESLEVQRKHVLYHVVNVNSNISIKNRAKLFAFPGFSSVKYAKYAYFDDPNQTIYNTMLSIIKKFDNIDGKILVFVPTIESVEEIYKRLKKDVSYKSIGQYHSKVDKEEKDSAKKKDIIVSTEKSLGTGTDIKGLRCVILGVPIASRVLAAQMLGRLREFAPDKDTYFFDIVDGCIAPVNWYFNSRFKKIKVLAKEVIYLNNINS